MSDKILSLHKLSCCIDENELFNRLSVSFLPSSIIHIKGSNGVGKTSLLRIIAGVQKPSDGCVYYGNPQSLTLIQDLDKPYCTYIGHNNALKAELTVLENLQFWSELFGSNETLAASIYYFELQHLLNQKCYALSDGYKQKVALSKLLSCQTNLWILDEVEIHLDAHNRTLLNNLIITKANNGGIILFATHDVIDIQNAQVLELG